MVLTFSKKCDIVNLTKGKHKQNGGKIMVSLNEMLLQAITTDSRKRKARYQTELEALGYKIVKDGSWFIRNTKTGRFIELAYNDDYLRTSNRNIKFGHVYSYKKHKYINKPLSVIDLAGLLNKKETTNVNYCDTWTNVQKLSRALNDRNYYTNKLSNSMNEFQTKIDEITREYQKKLEDAKRSYEWSVEYYTDSLNNANKNINKLLHKGIDK